MLKSNLFGKGEVVEEGGVLTNYVAFYPLTGTAEDVTTNFDGTEMGGLTYIDDATRGAVANLDGTSYVTGTAPISYGYSISLQFKISSVSKGFTFFSQHGSNYEYFYGSLYTLDSTTLRISVYVRSSSGDFLYIADTVDFTDELGEWNHGVLVLNSIGDYVFYLNGTPHTVTTVLDVSGSPQITTSNPKMFNVMSESVLYPSTGEASNPRVYDRILTQQEVLDIRDYELANHHIPVDDGLIAYYPCKRNSMDNYFNQYDGTDISVTYDGTEATITTSITVPSATGFVEMYYTFDGTPTYTTTEVTVFGAGALSNVRKYNRNLSEAEKTEIGY